MKPLRYSLKKTLRTTGDKTKHLAQMTSESLISGFDRLLDRRICLGVTGFSGSGKTTLITSLIHQLRYYPDAALTAFPPALQNRLLGVEMLPLGELPVFPYKEGIDFLSDCHWPQATRQESGCLLDIKYQVRKGQLIGKSNRIGRLFLEIHDYPGEWLLDLPMMELSYKDWCQQYHRQIDAQEQHDFIQTDFIQTLHGLDPFHSVTDATLNSLWKKQLDFLADNQNQKRTLLQPGRLLHAAPDAAESETPFIPLPNLLTLNDVNLQEAPPYSLYKQCEKHYQHYVDHWVKPFYRNTFQKVDRQIVLVDVLRELNRGEASLNNLCQRLSRVLQSFDYGHNNLIHRLFNPKIDRVVFAASKIDQVLPEQHENVRNLMASLVREAQRRATFSNIDVRCEAVAAVRSTTHALHRGQTVLKGYTEAGPGLLKHPPIPEALPTAEDWKTMPSWQLRKLLPPANLQLHNGGRLPHIRLDSVLNDLLGDKFL